MPFGEEGTADRDYFTALYQGFIKPVFEDRGYLVRRADDRTAPGAITRDIIVQLASAAVVVADMSDLNPNVFYEVGVRHALRRNGTILILDRLRSPTIPFDLSAYNTVFFDGDVPGIQRLRDELAKVADGLSGADPLEQDNPVHDFLPSLPLSALDVDQADEVQSLRAALNEHRTAASAKPSPGLTDSPLLDIVGDFLVQARDGKLPADLVRAASEYARQQNPAAFLEITKDIFTRSLGLNAVQYLTLTAGARSLDLFEVTAALLAEGSRNLPGDAMISRALMAVKARRSAEPKERADARAEILSLVGITVNQGLIDVPDELSEDDEAQIGTLLDSLQEDGLAEEEIRTTAALLDRFPHRTFALRNHARALERSGKDNQEAEALYERGMEAPDADDTSAIWFAQFMGRNERHADSIEPFLRACSLDPDDATPFAFTAVGVARALRGALTNADKSHRSLPSGITTDTVSVLLGAAFSCESMGQSDLQLCMRAVQLAELDAELVNSLTVMRSGGDGVSAPMGIGDRFALVQALLSDFSPDARGQECETA